MQQDVNRLQLNLTALTGKKQYKIKSRARDLVIQGNQLIQAAGLMKMIF